MTAWTAPKTWTAGERVLADDMNAQIRDDMLHIAGNLGFTATPATSAHGIEPVSGYFAGATKQNYHIEGGTFTATTPSTGNNHSFALAYAVYPDMVLMPTKNGAWDVQLLGISTTGFIVASLTTLTSGRWLAWGTDT